jgi:hypothetical protein
MDPMRKVGFIMVIPGAILLILMMLPFFFDSILPRGNLPFTYTWASVLGLFFFSAGIALVWVTGGIWIRREKKGPK